VSFFDPVTFARAFSVPGIDPRQWISMGTVELETSAIKSVTFNDSDGTPATPIVAVRLHPSNITVACRVAASVAGAGEGEWSPIGPGDEVVVAIPEGSERAGCVIVGRMGNGLDTWPQSVAGQDATANTFAFKRLRSPYILETASSYMVRSATTGAALTIDLDGNVIINNGAAHQLVLRSDVVSLSLGDDSAKIQLDPDASTITDIAGNGSTTWFLDGSASQFTSSGSVTFATNGELAFGHGVTLEQVVNLFVNFLYLISGPQGSSTLQTDFTAAGKILSAIPQPFPNALDTALQLWLTNAGLPTPPTPATGGGNYATFPLTFAPVSGAIALALANPIPPIDITGFIPGVGKPGFML